MYRIFTLVVTTVLTSLVAAQDNFLVSGVLPEKFDGAEIQLISHEDAFDAKVTTSVKGKFFFSGRIDRAFEPVYFRITYDDITNGIGPVFLKKGDSSMLAEFPDVAFSRDSVAFHNAPFVTEYRQFYRWFTPMEDSIITVKKFIYLTENEMYKGNADSLHLLLNCLQSEKRSCLINFIRSIPDSYFALYLFEKHILNSLLFRENDTEYLITVYEELSADIKETDLGREIDSVLKKRQSLLVNSYIPDFSFRTTGGQVRYLHSFRGKQYVFLYFWASWCGPCKKDIPVLLELENIYKPRGVQFIGISIDDEEEKWQKALEEYKPPGLHSCDIFSYNLDNPIRDLYNITHVPQYFLLDKSGKLIYHDMQMDDDRTSFSGLKEILEEVLE